MGPHSPRLKQPPGRPVKYPMPELIPDTPENFLKTVLAGPPKKRRKCLKDRFGQWEKA